MQAPRRYWNRLLQTAAVTTCFLLGTIVGCGDDSPGPPPMPRARARPKPKLGKVPDKKKAKIAQTKLWKVIQPAFDKHLGTPLEKQMDPFERRVELWKPAPPPGVPEVETPEPEKKDDTVAEPPDPKRLRMPVHRPLREYKLLGTATGKANPTAFIVGPKGHMYVVGKDDEIGNRKGRVREITRFRVIIDIPNEEEPHIFELERPFPEFKQIYVPKS